MPKLIDLTGKRFGKLTVIERVPSKEKETIWLCQCDCGNLKIAKGLYLRVGDTKSCGCIAKDLIVKRNTKHGLSKTRLYRIYKDILRRCRSKTRFAHEYYFDKGITVCDEWASNFSEFYAWSMSNGYSDELTIDRIDFDKGYSPENCRWVSMKEQCNNKTNNRHIELDGKTYTVSQLSDKIGINRSTLYNRLYVLGWDVKRAVSTSVKERG